MCACVRVFVLVSLSPLIPAVLPYTPYWILSTDYVNTAVVYSCTDILRLFHVEFAWVLSRVRAPPASALEKAFEVFGKNSIDVTQMINTRQQGCDKAWV